MLYYYKIEIYGIFNIIILYGYYYKILEIEIIGNIILNYYKIEIITESIYLIF